MKKNPKWVPQIQNSVCGSGFNKSNDARGIISGFVQSSFQKNKSAMLENELGLCGTCSSMDAEPQGWETGIFCTEIKKPNNPNLYFTTHKCYCWSSAVGLWADFKSLNLLPICLCFVLASNTLNNFTPLIYTPVAVLQH